MQTPVLSQAEQKLDVAAAQQLPWQSRLVHWLFALHAAPLPSSEQSPETSEYGELHAVHAPVASHVLHSTDLPAAQQKAWQSPLLQTACAVHAVPVGARQSPADAV